MAGLVASLAELCPRDAVLPLYSSVDASRIAGPALDASYWGRNLRCTVRFGDTIAAMLADGIDTFIELGPHPVLSTAMRQVAESSNRDVITLASARRDEPERLQMLTSLGELFAGGHDAALDHLYGEGYARVDLPFYPWQRERHWIEIPSAAPRDEVEGGALLGAGVISSTQAETTLWNVDIGRAAFPYLGDHSVNSVTVFPAAGFVEMALEAAAQAAPKQVLHLSDISIDTALIVPEHGNCRAQIAVEPGPVGTLIFTISSYRADSGTGTAEWTVHARGAIVADFAVSEVAGSAQDLRDAATSGAASHYEDMALCGLEYGPAFRGVQALRKTGNAIAAEVALPDTVVAGQYRIHPALLDACLQIAVAFRPPCDDDTRTPVPVAIERMVSLRPVGDSAVLHVRATPRRDAAIDGTGFSVDLVVVSDEGPPIFQIDGLRFALLDRAQPTGSDHLYRMSWQDAPLPAATQTSVGWTVLADGRGVAEMLKPRLGSMLRDYVSFPGDHAVRAVLDRVLRGTAVSKDAHSVDGIVHFWSLDASDARSTSLPVLDLVQHAASLPTTRRLRVVLVTAGAQAVLEGEQPTVEQAALWGLGRVIANEHPELACTLIDLPAVPSQRDVEALAHELAAAPDGEQVALRDNRRFVARLARADALPQSPQEDELAGERPFCAHVATPGILDGIALRPRSRIAPRVGEVEIAIEATGLNFMNVMSALGTCPGYPNGIGPLGIECAGRVISVGDGVEGLALGDAVLALAYDSLASHVVANTRLVRRMPAGLGFAQAASVPVAFVTAHYGLNTLARIERGERVLNSCGDGRRWSCRPSVGKACRRRGVRHGGQRRETRDARRYGCRERDGFAFVDIPRANTRYDRWEGRRCRAQLAVRSIRTGEPCGAGAIWALRRTWQARHLSQRACRARAVPAQSVVLCRRSRPHDAGAT